MFSATAADRQHESWVISVYSSGCNWTKREEDHHMIWQSVESTDPLTHPSFDETAKYKITALSTQQ